jgi:hypothetical protein
MVNCYDTTLLMSTLALNDSPSIVTVSDARPIIQILFELTNTIFLSHT